MVTGAQSKHNSSGRWGRRPAGRFGASLAAALCAAVVLLAGAVLPPPSMAQTTLPGYRHPSIQTKIGIWYKPDAPVRSRMWQPGEPGQPLFIRARVLNILGEPVPGALVELWHADKDGFVETGQFRAQLQTDEKGEFRLTTVLPGYIFGPRHIHFKITHGANAELVTRVFFKRDPVIKLHDYKAITMVLEDGLTSGDTPALFGSVEFVLPPKG